MSYITIDVKNNSMLGNMNDSVIVTKLYSLEKQIEEKNKEIERLNNIINSFEKYLEENNAKYTLSKLKELKGDRKSVV